MNEPAALPPLPRRPLNPAGWVSAAALVVIAVCVGSLSYSRWREDEVRRSYREWLADDVRLGQHPPKNADGTPMKDVEQYDAAKKKLADVLAENRFTWACYGLDPHK